MDNNKAFVITMLGLFGTICVGVLAHSYNERRFNRTLRELAEYGGHIIINKK